MKRFRLVSIFVALAMVLTTATVVMAAKPEFWTGDSQGTDTYSCGDFQIQDEWNGHMDVREYYDNHGNYIRTGARMSYTDRWVNLVNGNELFVTNGEHEYWAGDLEGVTIHGILYHVVVPGVGNVLMDAGYISYVWDEQGNPTDFVFHGNHQLNVEGDLSELCAVLQ